MRANTLKITASEIATLVQRTKRAILLKLAGIDGVQVKVRGQNARAWTLDALPAPLRYELECIAHRENFRDVPALVENMRKQTAPSSPALPASVQTQARDWHADLVEDFQNKDNLPNRDQLTPKDREWIWSQVFRHVKAGLSIPGDHALFKRSLVETLLRELPALVRPGAKNPVAALRRDMLRKLSAIEHHGRDSLRDGRTIRSGHYRNELCPKCWENVLAVATGLAGRERHAWRILKTEKRLCQTCDSFNEFNPRHGKSSMPRKLANRIAPFAAAAQPWIRGDSYGRNAGPHIHRDWSDTQPGDFFVADDVTWNHEVFDYAPDGQPIIGRPECLYAGDELTSCPLQFDVLCKSDASSRASYNGRHVLGLRLRVHDKFGLPHGQWKHENGVWRARTAIDSLHQNHRQNIRDSEDWMAAKYGTPGIRYFLPRNPRAKVIEGDFNILQQRMRLERGFVGFRERDEKSDAIKDFKRRVMAGKEDPRNELFSVEQWTRRIGAILEEFMHEPRGGRIDGRSPWEAWQEGMNAKPLRKLAPEDRWMLASHCRLETVKPHGIEFKIGKDSWGWADEQLVRYLGQQVWCWYHVDCPTLLTVANHKRTEFFSVPGNRLLANTASREDSAAANRRIAGFNRVPKVIAGLINHPVIATITRDKEFAEPIPGMGEHVTQAKAEHVARTKRHRIARGESAAEGARLMQSSRLKALAEESELQP